MTALLVVALWSFHGVALAWNWGRFRPHIAALHGVGMAAMAGLLLWVALPLWALYAAGALVGFVGGWGHPWAPGLFIGVGLLGAVPFLLGSAPALTGAAAFALAAQVAAALASLSRPAR